MDNQNQPAPASDPMQVPPAAADASAFAVSQEGSSPKVVYVVLAVMALIAVAVGGYYMVPEDKAPIAVIPTGESGIVTSSLAFNGKMYERGYAMPQTEGLDYVVTSYEWVPGGETLDTWTSLITTHKMAPKDASKPLSAESYAENVAAMNEQQGAVLVETSIINTKDAIEQAGVDPNNPPYLLVYAYSADDKGSIEVSIQKVLKGEENKLHAFVYSYRLNAKTIDEINAHFQSDEFASKRAEVIKTAFPY